jgi:hypothetical protein
MIAREFKWFANLSRESDLNKLKSAAAGFLTAHAIFNSAATRAQRLSEKGGLMLGRLQRNGYTISQAAAREITKTKDGEEADQVIRKQLEVRKANGKKAKVTRKAITRTREPQPEPAPEQDQQTGDIKLLDALAPIVGTLTDLANQAFDDGRSEASVPVTLLQSLDTIVRQARGE